jgi:hypothetical protein
MTGEHSCALTALAKEKITLEEYYRWMFENTVPGLPEKAGERGLTPLEYMRRHGCVEIARDQYRQHEAEVETDLGEPRSAAASARSRPRSAGS